MIGHCCADVIRVTMHVIPISCDGECPEWTMIEMQGELERKGAVDPDQEFPIGQLRVSRTVSLFIYALSDRFHRRPLCLISGT